DAVRDSFLALDRADPQRREILEALSASKYVPARDADYAALREAALEAGLLKSASSWSASAWCIRAAVAACRRCTMCACTSARRSGSRSTARPAPANLHSCAF